MLKFLIVLVYYERYNIVRNALDSISRLTYDNWELAVIDDGSKVPVKPIVEEVLEKVPNTIRFYENEYDQEPEKRTFSIHGQTINTAIADSNADVVIILCDDDALCSDYLTQLDRFYSNNPLEVWAYCHIRTFDPSKQIYITANLATGEWLNRTELPINPSCQLDASQVTFRSHIFRNGIAFKYPMTSSLDAQLFSDIFNKYGLCRFMGTIGQYKGVFSDQLGKRKDPFKIGTV